jgi:hypothetical protein
MMIYVQEEVRARVDKSTWVRSTLKRYRVVARDMQAVISVKRRHRHNMKVSN